MEQKEYSRVGIVLLVFSLFTATLYTFSTYVQSPEVYHFQQAALYDTERDTLK